MHCSLMAVQEVQRTFNGEYYWEAVCHDRTSKFQAGGGKLGNPGEGGIRQGDGWFRQGRGLFFDRAGGFL
jgi:hypothetical protein